MNYLGWISLEYASPKVHSRVLVTDGKGLISLAVYWGRFTQKEIDEKRNDWDEQVGDAYWVNQHERLTGKMIDHNKITHWLPIEALVATLPNADENGFQFQSSDNGKITQIQVNSKGSVQTIT